MSGYREASLRRLVEGRPDTIDNDILGESAAGSTATIQNARAQPVSRLLPRQDLDDTGESGASRPPARDNVDLMGRDDSAILVVRWRGQTCAPLRQRVDEAIGHPGSGR